MPEMHEWKMQINPEIKTNNLIYIRIFLGGGVKKFRGVKKNSKIYPPPLTALRPMIV